MATCGSWSNFISHVGTEIKRQNVCSWSELPIQTDLNHVYLLMLLKVLDTFGIIVKDQYSNFMYPNIMHTITNLWKFELHLSSNSQENNERKTPMLLHCFVCFQMHDASAEVLLLEWEMYTFLINYILQREPFLTMFYTIKILIFYDFNIWLKRIKYYQFFSKNEQWIATLHELPKIKSRFAP